VVPALAQARADADVAADPALAIAERLVVCSFVEPGRKRGWCGWRWGWATQTRERAFAGLEHLLERELFELRVV
jgi:hypothetical protein